MAASLNIIQFPLEDKKIKDFINVPYTFLKKYPYWIAPLKMQLKDNFNPSKNPFWKLVDSRFFIAYNNKKAIGRIAAIYHSKYNDHHLENTGFFGYLDAIDDQEVFKALFESCTKWLKTRKVTKIIGPLNPSLNYELGTLVKGFDQLPKFMMPFNPEYYDVRIMQSGYEKSLDFYAYDLDVPAFHLSPRMIKVSTWLKNRFNISFTNINFKQVKIDAKKVHAIYNEAFKGHWGFTPFELEEVEFMAQELKTIVDKDLFFFINIDGNIAGFILALPDLNEAIRQVKNGRLFPLGIFKLLYYSQKIKRVRVLNVAVKNEYRNLGLGVLLYEELQRRMKEKNYEGGELSWVAENNPDMNQGAKEMGAKISKKYRIYEKLI